MNNISDKAKVHEKTVQKASELAAIQTYNESAVAARRYRRRYEAQKKRPSDLTSIKVDRLVWNEAQRIKKSKQNSYSVIEIISEHEVILR